MTESRQPDSFEPDPQSVALFASVPEFDLTAFTLPATSGSRGKRAGRVRSTFSMGRGAEALQRVTGENAQPTPGPRPAAGWGEGGVNWAQVAKLRESASRRWAQLLRDNPPADDVAREALGREAIEDVLSDTARERMVDGLTLPHSEREVLTKALSDALFALGRFQPLVERDDVENVLIQGTSTQVELIDGTRVSVESVTETDDELITVLQDMAARAEPARAFSQAAPSLHLDLNGARLAATAFVTDRPIVVIRRHRLIRVTLDDLVAVETMDPVLASFLAAVVRSRMSVVVSGEMGDGKTTLLRALCAEIPVREVVGTFETEYELMLHKLDENRLVFAWQSRPGSGERGPDGRPVDEYTLAACMWDSFRFSLNRQVVGEVRGAEVAVMIKAMESGGGSLSTTHSRNASDTIEKLVSCAMEAGQARETAVSKLSRVIDVVVQMRTVYSTDADGTSRKRRIVDEVLAVTPGEKTLGYSLDPIFTRNGDDPARPNVLPSQFEHLAQYGFDVAGFRQQARHLGGAA